MSKVKTRRHIAKTLSYRAAATVVSMGMIYMLTGEGKVAAGYAAVETVVKMLVYFGHERVWYKFIKYGVTRNGKNNGN